MDLSTLDVIWKVVLVFGLIVFVHELGHFSLAKLVGVGVERFSLGFGPKLVGRTVGETEYLISAVPLGGYVKMVGEETGEEIAPEDIPRSFPHQSLMSRFLIVAAGPCANIVTAFLLFGLAFASFGIPVAVRRGQGWRNRTRLAGPTGRAAARGRDYEALRAAGCRPGREMAEHIRSSGGAELSLRVRRADSPQPLEVVVSPELRQGMDQGRTRAIRDRHHAGHASGTGIGRPRRGVGS